MAIQLESTSSVNSNVPLSLKSLDNCRENGSGLAFSTQSVGLSTYEWFCIQTNASQAQADRKRKAHRAIYVCTRHCRYSFFYLARVLAAGA